MRKLIVLQKTIEKIKKINETLIELCIGILLFAIVCQLILLLFAAGNIAYSIGLWIGTVLALSGSVHMWWSLDRALDYGDDARKLVAKHSMLRYGILAIVLGLTMISGFANPLTAFLGYMGMKAAAYMQPFIHKVLSKYSN